MAETAQETEEKTQDQQDTRKQAQEVEFSEAQESEGSAAGANIDLLLDVSVPVTAVIDKAEIPVQRLLQLGPGSVLKLGKPIDEPVDLYLKNVRFATATVVVVDERFAVRIKEILQPALPADEN